MREEGSKWVLPLCTKRVERCCLDYAVSLEFGNGPRITVRIEGAFSLDSAGVTRIVSAAKPESVGPALVLVHQVVEEALASKDGGLFLRFSNGARLTVAPSGQYESWELFDDRGLKVVSMPGGSLAIWLPPDMT